MNGVRLAALSFSMAGIAVGAAALAPRPASAWCWGWPAPTWSWTPTATATATGAPPTTSPTYSGTASATATTTSPPPTYSLPVPSTPSSASTGATPTGPSGPATTAPSGPSGPVAPASPSQRSGTSLRPGSNDGGSAPRSGPGRRRSGLGWEGWWTGDRLRHWPARMSGRAGLTIAPGARDPASGRFDWVAALEKALGSSPQTGDKRAAAYAGSYLRDPALLPMMARLACDESEDVRDVGVLGMGMCGSSRAETFALLVGILGDLAGDQHRRGGAAAALGHIGDAAAAPLLERALLHRGNVLPVRVGAAMGLGLLGDPSAAAALTEVLRDRREDDPVRAMAAAALGMLARAPGAPGKEGGAPSRADPARVLADVVRDPDALAAPARQTALLSLGLTPPDSETVARLIGALRRDPDAGARACAALALGRISTPGSGAERSARTALLAALEDEAPDVRSFLLLGLGLGRHREARGAVEAVLAGGGDPSARGAAAIALGLLEDPASVAALAAVAGGGGDPGLRASAAEALGLIAGASRANGAGPGRTGAARQALGKLADTGGPEVRGAACYGLGLAGDPADLPRLAEGLAAGTPFLRQGAILGLAALGGEEARDRLFAHVPRESLPELRGLSIRAAALACAATPVRVVVRTPPLSPWLRLPE